MNHAVVKGERSGDYRRESRLNIEYYEESETGNLNLWESLEAIRGSIAPQPPTNDSNLHRQILEFQVHLQKIEAEKAELIKEGNHQDMDWVTPCSAVVGREARGATETHILQENLHQAAAEHS